MPPLIPTPAPAPSIIARVSAGAARQAAPASSSSSSSSSPLSSLSSPSRVPVAASFSTTASRPKFSKARRLFREWERNQGAVFRRHTTPGRPTYLLPFGANRGSARFQDEDLTGPFPLNPHFKGVKVLDEQARKLIWQKVMRDGETIKGVSAEFGVDIRRVAAIVRLKEVEQDWLAKGKPLARPYAKAVLSMMHTHYIHANQANPPFEPINELHVHPYTMQQIFWPTSESRHFTREDAAKAFHATLLSPDKRVPHPELIEMEREIEHGRPLWDASERFKQAVMESERRAAEKQIARAAREEKRTTRINTERFEFRFKQFNSENVGRDGRSRRAVGWRYGAPHDDRSKGHQIKIPTSVP
ncbi:putative 37S ribosomal protein mitochondrial [Rosellinia necatrix]|uniref:Putative 37S ribosomal protein mitochondrial n=1 Tax=Rosellinia necatrix TaxID=77044 RepID=A0A1W2TNJ1_ROSNE|nr:putative 37S ribosomal protein mitochondrial [Rosellinia necatrix]